MCDLSWRRHWCRGHNWRWKGTHSYFVAGRTVIANDEIRRLVFAHSFGFATTHPGCRPPNHLRKVDTELAGGAGVRAAIVVLDFILPDFEDVFGKPGIRGSPKQILAARAVRRRNRTTGGDLVCPLLGELCQPFVPNQRLHAVLLPHSIVLGKHLRCECVLVLSGGRPACRNHLCQAQSR